MKTIVGLFEDWSTARQVLEELARAGFDRDDINLVANDANKTYAQSLGDGNGNSHGSGARTAEGAASAITAIPADRARLHPGFKRAPGACDTAIPGREK